MRSLNPSSSAVRLCRIVSTCLGLVAVLRPAMLRAQAVVTFGTPAYIAGDSDVATSGSFVWAYSFNGSTTSNPVVNGVTFTGTSLGGSDLTFVTASGSTLYAGGAWGFGSTASFYTSLSSGYQTLLNAGMFWSGGTGTQQMTLNNLVSGHSYRLQFWVNDSRGYHTSDYVILSDGLGHSADVRFNNGSTSLGQYVTATFLASGSAETFSLAPGSSSEPQINAMTLYDVTSAIPEPPAAATLLGLAAIAFVLVRRRRRDIVHSQSGLS